MFDRMKSEMGMNNIVVKFANGFFQSTNNGILPLISTITQDEFLNQFRYQSIVTNEIMAERNKVNMVSFENLVGICYVQNTDNISLEEKKLIAKKLDTYDFVEYAYVENIETMKLLSKNQTSDQEKFTQLSLNDTPSFLHLQGYKDGITSTHIGIDAEYAWSIGITGQGIKIADIDGGFNYNHVNLKRESFVNVVNDPDWYKDEHATAVTGVMYANNVGFGVKGMVHGADRFYGISYYPHGKAGGILKGLSLLEAGDVFIYELQTKNDSRDRFIPSDYERAVWDVTNEGLKKGIIILMAAGNGDENLDLDIYSEYRNRPDNGVIRVGAGDKFQKKASFSTYGSMVHVQGWGTWNVVTTGYNGLYNDFHNNNYTKTFSGTSSATPIAASAAVAVQSWYKEQTGKVLTPHEMRALLIDTGTHQQHKDAEEKEHIGPIPNVRNAINELSRRMALLK